MARRTRLSVLSVKDFIVLISVLSLTAHVFYIYLYHLREQSESCLSISRNEIANQTAAEKKDRPLEALSSSPSSSSSITSNSSSTPSSEVKRAGYESDGNLATDFSAYPDLRIAIVSAGRSGSTAFASLFAFLPLPQSSYVFEPLYPKAYDNETRLRNTWNCKIHRDTTGVREVVFWLYATDMNPLFHPKFTPIDDLVNHDWQILQGVCLTSRVRTVKTIRTMDLRMLQNLMEKSSDGEAAEGLMSMRSPKAPKNVIIGLFRDPRSTASSWLQNDWVLPGRFEEKVSEICDGGLKRHNYILAQSGYNQPISSPESLHSGTNRKKTYHLHIRYEDWIDDQAEMSRWVYRTLGLPINSDTENVIGLIGKRDAHVLTDGFDSHAHQIQWRRNLNQTFLDEVERICGDYMLALNYTLAKDLPPLEQVEEEHRSHSVVEEPESAMQTT